MVLPPVSTIKADMGLDNNGLVHNFFTQRCWVKMGYFTPGGQNGELHKNVSLKKDEIAYNSPYAHYMYMGELYVDPETGSSYARKGTTKVPTGKALNYHIPNTGAFWDKKMWNSKSEEIVKEVQQFLDRSK